MIYTAWGANGVAHTLHQGERRPCFADGTPDPDCPDLIWRIEAESWDGAMRRYHELQGWEPYEPMRDE